MENALNWLIRLLHDDTVESVESETIVDPATKEPILVDDIIIKFKNEDYTFVQCKIDSTDRNGWKLSDEALQEELKKAKGQLEQSDKNSIILSSQTPFGELKKLLDNITHYGSAIELLTGADNNIKILFERFAGILECDNETAFSLAARISVRARDFREWQRDNLESLSLRVPDAAVARDVLLSLIQENAARLPGSMIHITREIILSKFAERRIILCPLYSESQILEEFKTASKIGRQDIDRTISGEKLPCPQLGQLNERAGIDGITLIKGNPGAGKSWALLELAESIECDRHLGLLFIKGDRFASTKNEDQLSVELGLSGPLSGLVERLAQKRRVIVIVDSLDTLSLSGNHAAVETFLAVLDRLRGRPNVSLICACRSFDLNYDPLLRSRKWDSEIVIESLDIDRVVKPFLEKLGVETDKAAQGTLQLMSNPQYLKLYEAIHCEVPLSEVHSEQALLELFLREKVEKGTALGESAMDLLYQLSDLLVSKRSLRCERALLKADESMIRRLLSTGVISGDSRSIAFTHQTLLDSLWVKKARKDGIGLLEFILSRPILPFYRPTIRAYIIYLFNADHSGFSREVRKILESTEVPYHVRKLVLDTWAGLGGRTSELPLCRWLTSYDEDLFKRFLWVAKAGTWFRLFIEGGLIEEGLFGSSSIEMRYHWLRWVDSLSNEFPREIVSFWRRLIKTGGEELIRQIMIDADSFKSWTSEDRDIIEAFISRDTKARQDYHWAARAIASYSKKTGQGEDLLWGYIRWHIVNSPDFLDKYRFEIDFDFHYFGNEKLLTQLVESSPKFLSLIIEDLLNWIQERRQKHPERHAEYSSEEYLHSTSWEKKHNDYEVHHAGSFEILMTGVEEAIKKHARDNSDCWKGNAPKLAASQELGLIYLFVLACQEDVGGNIEIIESFLAENLRLLYGWRLDSEVWSLIHDASPYLSDAVLEMVQEAVISEVEKDDSIYVKKHVYNLLCHIPACYRANERVRYFIEETSDRLGPASFHPEIYGWGGFVPPPIPGNEFAALSISNQVKLLKFINKDWRSEKHFSDFKGMAQQISALTSADPERYLVLLDEFTGEDIEREYSDKIIEGCAYHLEYLFGNLRPPQTNWKALSQPDGVELARRILSYCEEYTGNDYFVAHCIEACSLVLHSPEDTSRLINMITRIISKCTELERHNDVASEALNTSLGKSSTTASRVYLAIQKNNGEVPGELSDLLFRIACHAYLPARWSLLRELPLMIRYDEEVSWELFQRCHADLPGELFDVSYSYIYYTYWQHPERYISIIDRMSKSEEKDIKTLYGNLIALYYLSQKIDSDEFWRKVAEADSEIFNSVWAVFTRNMDNSECGGLCIDGIRRMLQSDRRLNRRFDCLYSEPEKRLPKSLVLDYIAHLDDPDDHLFWINDWIGTQSKYYPLEVLEILEAFFKRIREIGRSQIMHGEGLVAATINILREADMLDDEKLINRAISLQDELLRLNVDVMEKALDESSRP